MSAPTSRHATVRGAVQLECEYQPDRARCVAALLALLTRRAAHKETADGWTPSTAQAEEPKDVPPVGTPACLL
jgi:hypothetical protein